MRQAGRGVQHAWWSVQLRRTIPLPTPSAAETIPALRLPYRLSSHRNYRTIIMTSPSSSSPAGGIRGFLFDMDGTLTVPVLDFALMRERTGVPMGKDILDEVEKMEEAERERCMKIIEEMEDEGNARLQLQPGLKELFGWMKEHSHGPFRTAIVTRNSSKAVDHFLRHSGLDFDLVLDRSFRPYKPAPAPILHICQQWDFSVGEVLFIGDSKDDLESAAAAGCKSVLIKNSKNQYLIPNASYHVDRLDELIPLFDSLIARPAALADGLRE